jgi:hypothetical protein
MANRYIFRRQDPSGPESAEVARTLKEAAGARILDESSQSLFVQGEEGLEDSMAGRFSGWTITPERRLSVPDARPKVSRRAGG